MMHRTQGTCILKAKVELVLKLILGFLIFSFSSLLFAEPVANCNWPMWQAYSQRFIQSDGRVIDYHGENNDTTSEGEAYSLFFALVNNDQETFKKILNWIRYNLSDGDLTANLPAWHWGKQANGKWGVLDKNSAADADLWLAYSLYEAGRLWRNPEYQALGSAVLSKVKLQEVVYLNKTGAMLLPAPKGFDLGNNRWRFNPSYLPIFLARYFAKVDPAGPWQALLENQLKMLQATQHQGYAPDWAVYEQNRGWVIDEQSNGVGSFDAIRNYLWIGLLDAKEPNKKTLLKHYTAMNKDLNQTPTKLVARVNTPAQEASKPAPVGFYAALMPYVASVASDMALKNLQAQIQAQKNGSLLGDNPSYYDQALGLFGFGWLEQRYRLNVNGELSIAALACPPTE